MKINWKKGISLGALLWVLMFVIVSIFVGFKIYDSAYMKVITALIAGIISFVLVGYVKPDKVGLAFSYGILWVVIGLILDAIVTRLFNPQIFLSKGLWLGYALVLIAPLFRVKKTGSNPNQTAQ